MRVCPHPNHLYFNNSSYHLYLIIYFSNVIEFVMIFLFWFKRCSLINFSFTMYIVYSFLHVFLTYTTDSTGMCTMVLYWISAAALLTIIVAVTVAVCRHRGKLHLINNWTKLYETNTKLPCGRQCMVCHCPQQRHYNHWNRGRYMPHQFNQFVRHKCTRCSLFCKWSVPPQKH